MNVSRAGRRGRETLRDEGSDVGPARIDVQRTPSSAGDITSGDRPDCNTATHANAGRGNK